MATIIMMDRGGTVITRLVKKTLKSPNNLKVIITIPFISPTTKAGPKFIAMLGTPRETTAGLEKA